MQELARHTLEKRDLVVENNPVIARRIFVPIDVEPDTAQPQPETFEYPPRRLEVDGKVILGLIRQLSTRQGVSSINTVRNVDEAGQPERRELLRVVGDT